MNIEEIKNKITLGDCLDVMKSLPDKCIDLILTDPPYGISCDGGSYGLGVKPKQLKQKSWDGAIPLKVYFDEMFRVSKNQIIFGGNYFTDFLKPTKSWIIWDKIGSYNLKNNFSECEMIWTSLKNVTKKITFIQQGFINSDKDENKHRFHPTQKPLRLVEQILRTFAPELVGGGGGGWEQIFSRVRERRLLRVIISELILSPSKKTPSILNYQTRDCSTLRLN